MVKIQDNFLQYYTDAKVKNLYPDEWARKTFLGQYPGLVRRANNFAGRNILDLGCGDGRNMVLFKDMGFNVYGVEISESLCAIPRKLLSAENGLPDIRVGTNSHLPFERDFFDCVFSSSAFYYVWDNQRFSDNMQELLRVLKPGGWFVASFPNSKMQMRGKDYWAGVEKIDEGHYIMKNDPLELRNGSVFRYFQSRQDVLDEFSKDFTDISIGEFDSDFYGNRISYYMLSCYKKDEN